jgi:protein-L-isoaspartate(D-aspartate) O-methyltransferase
MNSFKNGYGSPDFGRARERMVEEYIIPEGILDPRVIAAMKKVPRHLFVPEALQGRAYGDSALPIGEGQTISQPSTVAYMCQALQLTGRERVLEIGTGSGYQAAVLAQLAERVFSVEKIRALLERARKVLDRIDCRNVLTRLFDGTYGWKEEAPFDAVIVAAGAPFVPPPLLEQLKAGGRMIIPVGERGSQTLHLIHRSREGFRQEDLKTCTFVALIGKYGWVKETPLDPYAPRKRKP